MQSENVTNMDGESSKRIKLDSLLHDDCLNLNLHSLSLKDLREITNDFSDENLLGQGGFGSVYKGLLQNGNIIAVKKLTSTMPGLHDKKYENEVRHLMRLIHPNIVQLVGYCSETEKDLVLHNGKYVYAEKSERLLCLEYMPKGSLRNHISDFGLSRLFGEEQTRTTTKNCDGTLGYMAPEYLTRGIITKELDIFSLGVIIIQVVTGQKHYPYKDDETSSQEFVELVLKEWKNRLEKVPGYISQEFDCLQIRRCIEIGLLCVKFDRAERPTTRRIIDMLILKDAECSNEREARVEHAVVTNKFLEQFLRERGCSEAKERSSTLSSLQNAGKVLKKGREQKKMSLQVRLSSATASETPVDDGFSWRKYGQKDIPGAKHPRAYYRCAQRHSSGCPATKRVQRTDEDPTLFDVIYNQKHTCVQSLPAAAAAGQPEHNPDANSLLQSPTAGYTVMTDPQGWSATSPFSFSNSTPAQRNPFSSPSTSEYWGVSPATSDSNNHVAASNELHDVVSALAAASATLPPPTVADPSVAMAYEE